MRGGDARPARREGIAVFGVALGVYVTAAAVLLFHYGYVVGDALARVANASYVLQSRDPHLAAIGFVWGPLPSLLVLPVVALRPIFPSLVALGFAGGLTSAFCMAAVIATFDGILRDERVPAAARLVAVVLVGLNPAVVFYAANGMSEALYFWCLLVAARRLLRWWHRPEPKDLVCSGDGRELTVAGIALGAAYLCRYEALAAGAAASATVAAVTWARTHGPWRARRAAALLDATLLGFPFLLAFVGWAAASWAVVGHPFEQLSSAYGNAAQVAGTLPGAAVSTAGGRLTRLGHQVLGFAPTLPLVVLVAAILAARRRSTRALAVAAAVGAPLGMTAMLAASGEVITWMRYAFVAVPLVAAATAVVLGDLGRSRAGAAAAALVLLAPPAIGAAVTMGDRSLSPDHYAVVATVTGHDAPEAAVDPFHNERRIARDIDRLATPSSTVLVDSGPGFAIIAASSRPRSLVITNDRDFEAAVADPSRFGIRYLLVPDPAMRSNDALSGTYPSLWRSGAGIGHLVRAYPAGPDLPAWRLFEVDAPITG